MPRLARWTSSLLVVGLALAGRTLAQEGALADGTAEPDDTVDLADALDRIARADDLDVVLDGNVQERVSTSRCVGVGRAAIDALARVTRCEVEELPGGVLLLAQAPRVTLQFVETDVRQVLRLIAAYAGKNVLLAPAVRGRVTVDLTEVHWLAALDTVARAAGFVLVERPDGLFVVTDVLPPAQTPPTSPLVLDGPRVSLDVRDAPLEDVVLQLRDAAGRDVLVEPEVQERVTLRLVDVPWRAALEALARLSRCRIQVVGGVPTLVQPRRATYQAAGAPAATWFQLLARRAGTNLVAGELAGGVDCDLADMLPGDVLLATASVSGFGAERIGDTTRISPRAPVVAPATDRVEGLLDDVGRLARARDATALERRLATLLEAVRGVRPAPTPPPATRPAPRAVDERFTAELDALLEQVTALGEARQVEEIVARFTELRELVGSGGLPAVRAARERVARLRPRLEGLGELLLSLDLQLDIIEGNAHLRAMADALHRDAPGAMDEGLRGVEELTARMRDDGDPALRRSADALLVRAQGLRKQGERLTRFLAIPLAVTALAIGPGDDVPDQAIVNGWIVGVGECPRDAAGGELPSLVVGKIVRGAVYFQFEGVELVREVGAP